MPDAPAYELEFYTEEGGVMPALRWIKEDLSPTKRRALGPADDRDYYIASADRIVHGCEASHHGRPELVA